MPVQMVLLRLEDARPLTQQERRHLKKAEGRGHEACGTFQKGIQTPPEKEQPNQRFGWVLNPWALRVPQKDRASTEG